MLRAYRRKWLPHETDNEDSLATALFLEKDHNENMKGAVANGIGAAFKK